MNKMRLIRSLLETAINNIDTSNTNLSEEEMDDAIEMLNRLMIPETKYSKYQACKYLGVSRATFDNWVRDGKLPQGRQQQGFKEKYWLLSDLKTIK